MLNGGCHELSRNSTSEDVPSSKDVVGFLSTAMFILCTTVLLVLGFKVTAGIGLKSGSDLKEDDYNVYDYCSSEESDTTLVDHLSDDEEEVLDVRTKKRDHAPKKKDSKMFDESFFTSIFNGLPKDDFDDSSDLYTDDQDKLGDHWLIHDPKIK
nr:hypothetical protein CTI12_AA319060 [Tanacetum cinerariifolium]